jgi:hypothetical protein
MSKQLNIDDILAKHCPDIQNVVNISKEDIKSAIKDILEKYTEIVVENAKAGTSSNGEWVSSNAGACVYKPSIRNCLKLVKYE